MKANSFENLIADQIFKIQKADEDICDYLLDCFSPFNIEMDVQENQVFRNGTFRGLESTLINH